VGQRLALDQLHGEVRPPVGEGAQLVDRDDPRVLKLAADLEIPLVETIVPREMLYIADEVFFSGTAAEVTPIRSVDRIPVGKGRRGPITERLQKEFFAIVNGTKPDRHGWLTPVLVGQPAAVK
jgi:branched-chain amino acid aminotransferase